MGSDRVESTLSVRQIAELMERPDRLQLDWLLREFSNEFSALCDLARLPPKYNLVPFLIQLTGIIYMYRTRGENIDGAKHAIRDLEIGTTYIKRAIQGFAHINSLLLGAVLAETSDTRLMGLNAKHVPELLDESCAFLSVLAGAMRSAAEVTLIPRRRGDKRAYHFVPAIPLIELWESIEGIASMQQGGVTRRSRKRVPTPKRVPEVDDGGRKPTLISKQPSTEFIRIALRMIYPTITDAQVLTAISNARRIRNALCSQLGATNLFGFDEALGVPK